MEWADTIRTRSILTFVFSGYVLVYLLRGFLFAVNFFHSTICIVLPTPLLLASLIVSRRL